VINHRNGRFVLYADYEGGRVRAYLTSQDDPEKLRAEMSELGEPGMVVPVSLDPMIEETQRAIFDHLCDGPERNEGGDITLLERIFLLGFLAGRDAGKVEARSESAKEAPQPPAFLSPEDAATD
jgi:hypothetical protein